jgi:alkanesulfonate monooxygenase SsuD/methylene tetrahydromethanopterin reductase-like flavin-dependent oxidoreductase (luciferase family)
MVDLLSAGRLDFGIGRGFVAHDYKVLGVPYGEAPGASPREPRSDPVAALAELTRIYRDAFAAVRGDGARAPIATHFHTVVADDRAEARRIAEQALREHVRLNREVRRGAGRRITLS